MPRFNNDHMENKVPRPSAAKENQSMKKALDQKLPEVISIQKKKELISAKEKSNHTADHPKKIIKNDLKAEKTASPANFDNPVPITKNPPMNDDKLFDMEEMQGVTMADLMGPESTRRKKAFNKLNSETKINDSRSNRTVDEFDFDEETFLAALNEHEPIGIVNKVVSGIIVGIENDGIYIDIGGKAPGFMPRKECSIEGKDNLKENFSIGCTVEGIVIREQDANGVVNISYKALLVKRTWDKIRTLEKDGQSIQVKINGFNRGGLTCDFEGVRGFIPYSQTQRNEGYERMVGDIITVTFIEVNSISQKLVLSERHATTATRITTLDVGELVDGYITGVKPYGFFVELGGVSGLLHYSCLTNGNLREPQKLFREGDQIKALVTELDLSRKRISLNTALLEIKPGELLIEKEKVMNEATNRTMKTRKLICQQDQSAK